MWQIRQLEAFQAVMATGGMTRAAEGLHITQPAISKLISSLEAQCGFKLFLRRGNQLSPTIEANLLYGEVQRMLLGTLEIKRRAQEIREKNFGSLNLAAFPALATRVLPGIITRFCEEHPNVQMSLTGRSSLFMTNWLNAQRVDLGISILRTNQPGMNFERILRMEAICALPKGHRLSRHRTLTAKQIATEPFISLGDEDKTRTIIDRYFDAADTQPRIVMETQLSESACQFVVEGAGVSIVEPLSTMGFSTDQLEVRRISPPLYFDVWAITPTSRDPSLITSEFIEYFSINLKRILREEKFHYLE